MRYPIMLDEDVNLLYCKILGYYNVLSTLELSSGFWPGWGGGLTRKRRRASRSRWWGAWSGRRLLSAGPSSLVRRSRTCFFPAASPIFAPFSLSSPPTCRPVFGFFRKWLIILLCCKTHTRVSRQKSGGHLTFLKHCFEKCRSHIMGVC